MKVRLKILIIIFLGALVYSGAISIWNALGGCSKKTLDQFEQTILAKTYEKDFVDQEKNEIPSLKNSTNINTYWEISRSGNGCEVQFVISYFAVKNYRISGDNFFINLNDHKIYPQSEGAQIFLDYYKFDTSLQ